MADNYFAAEKRIAERLTQLLVPGVLAEVRQRPGIRDVMQLECALPAALVVFTDEDEVDAQDAGSVLEQTITVLIAVRAEGDEAEAHRQAGEIIPRVDEALIGWEPTDRHFPLRRGAMASRPYPGGGAHFAIPYKTRVSA